MSQDTHSILPRRRQAGVALHISSLPGDFGIGDIGPSAHRFLEQMKHMKLSVWQFLPTGPTAYGDSPYQPLSAFAGNENLIAIDPLVTAGLLEPEETAELRALPASTVDYGRLIPAKQAVLNRAADRFIDTACDGDRAAYARFIERHAAAWLDDYALFRILKAMHGERPWPEWSQEYVRREPAALSELRADASRDIERIKVLQFLFEQQWQRLHARARDLDIRLFSDMPIYIALDSADAWAHPELLMIDRDGRPSHVAGVPPDYFSEDGQLWGNPLYDWVHHERTGFSWWVDRLRHAALMSDMVRVDHFRGFEAYWSIPATAETAREGRWVPGPGFALFDALQSALGDLPIVAEDLGVITPQVDELRHRYRIPGMVVLQFEVASPGFRLEDIDDNSVCYTGTHDNDTTLGWFEGGHGDIRSPEEVAVTREAALRLTGATPATIHLGMVRLAFKSPSRLAIAPMQDYIGLGTEARVNIPGTTRDNWRWRVLEEQLADEFCARVADMVSAAARG